MSLLGEFTINGTKYDLDDTTLDEMEEIEELAGGIPFGELNYRATKTMKAIAYVLLKRTDPEMAFEEVGKVKITSLLPPDEEMPDLPPAFQGNEPNGSEPADSGVLPSVGSTTG